jgi:hypothetical protein
MIIKIFHYYLGEILGKEKALLRQSKTWRKIFIYEQ